MRLLILGGTPAHPGGVEQFCDRAMLAINGDARHHAEHVPSNAAYLRFRSLPRFLHSARRLVRERRRGWTVLWLQYTSLPDLALLAVARLCGFTILVTPHLGSGWASQSNPVLRWLSTRLLALAHGIGLLAPSQAREVPLPAGPPRLPLRTLLPRLFPAPVPRLAGGPARLVHAGRLSSGKGSFRVIDICGRLARAGYAFEAKLIGPCDAPTLRQLNAAIAAEGLGDRVLVLGALTEAELMRELAGADVLLHPSVIDSYPLIVLESIGCGAFPICIDLLGARLITSTYCGRVVPAGHAVADAAAVLIAEPLDALRREAAGTRPRLVDDFAWPACVDALEQAVNHLVAKAA